MDLDQRGFYKKKKVKDPMVKKQLEEDKESNKFDNEENNKLFDDNNIGKGGNLGLHILDDV